MGALTLADVGLGILVTVVSVCYCICLVVLAVNGLRDMWRSKDDGK